MTEINKPEVIQNSDHLYKSDIKWIDPNMDGIPSDYEIKVNKNFKTPKQLLEEEQNEAKVELTEDQKIIYNRKNYITKVKVISLHEFGKHPLLNPSYLSDIDKKKLMLIMQSNINNFNEEQITEKFNNLCSKELFNEKSDYSSYPVYA